MPFSELGKLVRTVPGPAKLITGQVGWMEGSGIDHQGRVGWDRAGRGHGMMERD